MVMLLRSGTAAMIMKFILQGDGDYELDTDVEMDDFLWGRIKKVRTN
jgi:hypothetical protein